MPRNRISKDLVGDASAVSVTPLPPSSSVSHSGITTVIEFKPRKARPTPEPPENTPHHGPRRSATVLDCVAVDMARRWADYETSIVTIRRKLNVSIPEAERIVRRGLRLRKVAA